MPRPILYTTDVSPPCRGVLMAAAAIGLELDTRETDLKTQENMKPEFVKVKNVLNKLLDFIIKKGIRSNIKIPNIYLIIQSSPLLNF